MHSTGATKAMISEEMKHLLQALDPTLPSEAEGAPEPEPPSNVITLPTPTRRPTGDEFTPEERQRLRLMLEEFDRVKLGCPVARGAAAKPPKL